MQHFHEFDCDKRHYTVDTEVTGEEVEFLIINDLHQKIFKIKADILNLNDNLSAMKSRIQTKDVNLQQIVESFAVGFITLPKDI